MAGLGLEFIKFSLFFNAGKGILLFFQGGWAMAQGCQQSFSPRMLTCLCGNVAPIFTHFPGEFWDVLGIFFVLRSTLPPCEALSTSCPRKFMSQWNATRTAFRVRSGRPPFSVSRSEGGSPGFSEGCTGSGSCCEDRGYPPLPSPIPKITKYLVLPTRFGGQILFVAQLTEGPKKNKVPSVANRF